MLRQSILLWVASCCLWVQTPVLHATPAAAHARAAHAGENSADDKEQKDEKDNDALVPAHKLKHPVLWQSPGNIRAKDLFDGAGGHSGHPVAPFKFLGEDPSGTNPKFDALDARGDKWRVKLGEEARPEVVASRLLWAVGYFVNDDFLEPDCTVAGVRLKRGENRISPGGHILNARFARKPKHQKKIGIWAWRSNPFVGRREYNGLRVMMAVMNNWDLKDVNNAVYEDKETGRQLFLVSDIGATFGANGFGFSKARAKGNINSFKESKFIQRVDNRSVDFYTPHRPTALLIGTLGATVKEFKMRSGLDWIGNDIPRADARWMGGLLGQLSHRQLVDAFRAGNFPPDAVDAYVDVVESRIAALKGL